MTTLYESGYLHLFYEDYASSAGGSFNSYAQIQKAKQNIRKKAKRELTQRAKSIQAHQQDIEELYNLKESEFANLMTENNANWNKAQGIMSNFDSAISKLKQLIQQKSTDVDEASFLSDQIVQSIDNILKLGQKTHGLSNAAMQQIRSFLDDYNSQVVPHLKWGYYRVSARNKKLLDAITSVQSNVSGYMLEIANVYAFIGANIPALQTIINIGGAKMSGDVKQILDPKLQADYQKLQAALAMNNGTQSKADNILILSMSNGNGNATMITSYLGMQDKNVSDVTRVKVGAYTLGQLGITNYYEKNYLVNTAGGLGHNFRSAKEKIGNAIRTHQSLQVNQGTIDEIWHNIKDSMIILGAADAVAGDIAANMTNQVDYYVIREKSTGRIRLISSGEIILNYLNRYLEKNINENIAYNSKTGNRKEYWTINYSAYVPDSAASSRPDAAQLRSSAAYGEILNAIFNTKLTITINFKEWFPTLT